MNIPATTRRQANLRGAIIVAATMMAAAIADPVVRAHLPPVGMSLLGIAAVGLGTLRAFIDNSNAQATATDAAQPTSTGSTPDDPPPPAIPFVTGLSVVKTASPRFSEIQQAIADHTAANPIVADHSLDATIAAMKSQESAAADTSNVTNVTAQATAAVPNPAAVPEAVAAESIPTPIAPL